MKRFDLWIGIAMGLALITASWRRWAFLWIVADILYIWLYISRDLQLTAVLYFVFLCLCVAGFLNWRRSLKAQAGAQQTAAAGNLSKEAAASD